MSNLEKAVDTIVHQNAQRRDRRGDIVEVVTVQAATEYVQALKDAGLLMPDLPEPTSTEATKHGTYTYYPEAYVLDGTVIPHDQITSGLTPTQARKLAYSLLAAANHAEQEQE